MKFTVSLGGKKKRLKVVENEKNEIKLLLNRGLVHIASHLQAVEALHVANGRGQHLSGLHGGHLHASLGQVTKLSQPRLPDEKVTIQ